MTQEQEINLRFSILQEALKTYGATYEHSTTSYILKDPKDIMEIAGKFYDFVVKSK